ncbi:MAG: class I SAM-dependent methyltransferase family protein [Desulfurococcales archaeon]|nr:class I SAM-dependent methyltransferase family protein [Desulfurococcales archaeon]
MDIVGDIAIIKEPIHGGLDKGDLERLARALLRETSYIRSVWATASPVRGEYKLRTYTHLAGEERSWTIYKEHGCRFKVDIAKVFITPRLNYEHARVASQVKPGEVVVNMFAGAGLFSIIIACKSRPHKVYSIDINEHAYKLMIENVRLNNVEDIVEPIHGDAAKVIEERLHGVADRVLMPLPDLALKYLPHALKALKPRGGVVHIYLHIHAPRGVDPLEKAWNTVKNSIPPGSRLLHARRVRPVGPRMLQVVLDVEVAGSG